MKKKKKYEKKGLGVRKKKKKETERLSYIVAISSNIVVLSVE